MSPERLGSVAHPFRSTSHDPDRDDEHTNAHPLTDLGLLAVEFRYRIPRLFRYEPAVCDVEIAAPRRFLDEDPGADVSASNM